MTELELGPTRVWRTGRAWGHGRIEGYPLTGDISSPFGPRAPILTAAGWTGDFHSGIDIPAPAGTLVLAPGDCVVTYQLTDPVRYGNMVFVRFADGTGASFLHLEAGKAMAGRGMKLRRGDILGFVGTTGMSTGNHLHYSRVKTMPDGVSYFDRSYFIDPFTGFVPKLSVVEPEPPEPVDPAERFRREALALNTFVSHLRQYPVSYDAALAAIQREVSELAEVS